MDNIIYYVSECLFDLIGQHVPWNMEFTYPQYIYIYCTGLHFNACQYISTDLCTLMLNKTLATTTTFYCIMYISYVIECRFGGSV